MTAPFVFSLAFVCVMVLLGPLGSLAGKCVPVTDVTKSPDCTDIRKICNGTSASYLTSAWMDEQQSKNQEKCEDYRSMSVPDRLEYGKVFCGAFCDNNTKDTDTCKNGYFEMRMRAKCGATVSCDFYAGNVKDGGLSCETGARAHARAHAHAHALRRSSRRPARRRACLAVLFCSSCAGLSGPRRA